MHTYVNAMNLDLPFNPNVHYQNLYLDVEYEVENGEVVVKSVRSYEDGTTPALSENACLSIAQQVQDVFECACDN